jgi:two-component system chemotaxis sensor kinase CheA
VISDKDMKLFYSEAEDLIQKIEDNLLILEENPKNNKPIQELFYVYHTLKGLTAMVGFENLSKFIHQFETFLEKNKNLKEQIKNKGKIIDSLFKSLDVIRNTIEKIKKGEVKDLNEQELERLNYSFEALDSEYGITLFKPISKEELENSKKNQKNKFYKIFIQIQSTCVFKKVRLFIIFRALNEIGRICASIPEPDKLEMGDFKNSFTVYFLSELNSDKIQNAIDEILEIENIVITKISAEDLIKFNLEFNLKLAQKEKFTQSSTEDYKTNEQLFVEEDQGELPSLGADLAYGTSKINSVKIDIDVIEQLMNYFGELVIIKNQINQVLEDRQERGVNLFFDNMDKLFLEIQEIIFKLKLVRVDSTFRKYRRLVRDVAKSNGKMVRLTLEGMDVEIDRKVLEELNSPLMHILRNSIYHGIETPSERKAKNKNQFGVINLRTFRSAGSIYIEIEDNGSGIDYERVRQKAVEKELYSQEEASALTTEQLNEIIFSSGFSTLEGANLISGRGMGLAIVAKKIEELGGSLSIYSEKDIGTTFTLVVPFTRAILKAQLMKVGGDLFAIPIENIKQIYFFDRGLIEYIKGVEYYRLNSKLIPIIWLNKYLEFLIKNKDQTKANSSAKIAILCEKDEENSALFVVDEILQQMEIVMKPFRTRFSRFQEILGTSITGDGSICLILDVLNIISSKNDELPTLQEIDLETTI